MFGDVADSFVGMGTPAAPAGAGGQDVAAQLTQLADLKNQGLLTDEEFEAAEGEAAGLIAPPRDQGLRRGSRRP